MYSALAECMGGFSAHLIQIVLTNAMTEFSVKL